MKSIVLIGGHFDGRRLKIEGDPTYLQLPRQTTISKVDYYIDPVHFSDELYKPVYYCEADGTLVELWVHEDFPINCIMKKLLSGYRGQ